MKKKPECGLKNGNDTIMSERKNDNMTTARGNSKNTRGAVRGSWKMTDKDSANK
jgi:hypothetical protein